MCCVSNVIYSNDNVQAPGHGRDFFKLAGVLYHLATI